MGITKSGVWSTHPLSPGSLDSPAPPVGIYAACPARGLWTPVRFALEWGASIHGVSAARFQPLLMPSGFLTYYGFC